MSYKPIAGKTVQIKYVAVSAPSADQVVISVGPEQTSIVITAEEADLLHEALSDVLEYEKDPGHE